MELGRDASSACYNSVQSCKSRSAQGAEPGRDAIVAFYSPENHVLFKAKSYKRMQFWVIAVLHDPVNPVLFRVWS